MKYRVIVATLPIFAAVFALVQPAWNARGAEADRQAVAQLLQQEITRISAGNIDGFMAILADNVVLMPPNEPAVVGQAAARAWAQDFLRRFKVEGMETSSELMIAGDWAFERLTYALKLTPTAGGAVVQDAGKGIHVYRRQADGSWRIAQDIWNSNGGAAPAQ